VAALAVAVRPASAVLVASTAALTVAARLASAVLVASTAALTVEATSSSDNVGTSTGAKVPQAPNIVRTKKLDTSIMILVIFIMFISPYRIGQIEFIILYLSWTGACARLGASVPTATT
jgi:Trk-type K+ transport system membrane component